MPTTAAAAQMQVSASTAAMQTHEFIKQLVALGLSEEVAETIASHQTTYVDRSASKGDIDGVKREIDGVKQEIDGVKREIDGVKREIDGVKRDINGIKQNIEDVKQNIEDVKRDIDGLKTSTEQAIKNSEEKMIDKIELAKKDVLIKAGFMVVAAVAFLTTIMLTLLPMMLKAA